MKSFILENEQRRTFVSNLILEQPVDGSVTVEIKKTVTASTAAQRRLKWLWNEEISRSGLGRDDTAQDVHIRNKMKFGHPIKMRDAVEADADFYPELYTAFVETYKNHPAYPMMVKFFADNHIKTEKFTRKQNAEYLTNVQRYWTGKGIELTDPALQGLDENLGWKPK
jgi:hypothetical protein